MAHDVKQFLDKAGVEVLWERIYNGFAPRWQSYKPSNNPSTTDDRKPADFINTYTSDYIVGGEKDGRKSLDVTFISAGAIADAEGNKYGRDLIVQIPEVKAPTSLTAEDGEYGVMSPNDKWKLDNIANTAEDKVTIKGVKVNNSGLILTDKFVNWDLQYDNTTHYLNVVDLNATNDDEKIKTRVYFGDLIKDSFLNEAKIVTVAEGEVDNVAAGLYIRLLFITKEIDGDESANDYIYINVNDLVDIYTEGTGISISNAEQSANDTVRNTIINLKTAAEEEIGGIKVYKDNPTHAVSARTSAISADVTDTSHRYFGVEIDKEDRAFVNVPITNITINEPNPEVKAATISPVTGGSFDIITNYNASADQNSVDGWVITPTTATITVNKETDWSTAWPKVEDKEVTSDGDKTLEFGKPFKVFKDIVEDGTNGHGTVKSVATLTMPTETILSLSGELPADDGTPENKRVTQEYSATTEKINDIENVPVSHQLITIKTSAVKSVDDHTIVCETSDNKFDICIPAIEESFIDSLVYRVQ